MANNSKPPVATLNISFSTTTTEDDTALVAELNAEDNNNITSFIFGGTAPKFRVYKSNNISEVHLFSSAGSITKKVSNKVATPTESLEFSGASEKNGDQDDSYRQTTVSKPVKGPYSVANIIGNIGVVSLIEEGARTTFQCSKKSTGPLDPVVGFCRVTYETKYDLYELSGVSKPDGFGEGEFTDYFVLVHVVGIKE